MDLSIFQIPPWYVLLPAIALLTIVYLYYSWTKRQKFDLPGPKPVPILGHFIDMFKYGLCDFDMQLVQKYGKVTALSSSVFGNFLGDIVVADPDMLKEVMVKQANVFSDRNVNEKTEVEPLDKSVFAVKGDHWKQMRSTMTPAFSSGKLRYMVSMISKCANTLVDNFRKKAKAGETFDQKIWGYFTMDVIGATAFGIEVDSQNKPDHPFVKNAEVMNTFSFADPFMLIFILLPGLTKKLEGVLRHVPGFRRILNPMIYFGEITKNLLKERGESPDGHHNDFMQLMLHAHNMTTTDLAADEKEVEKWKKKAMTAHEIAGNGLLFFIAGYGTTNDTLGYTAYLLATHPEIQERLAREIDEVLQGGEPTYENVSKLTYLEQVINESMRLYPVGIRVDRVANQDTTVNGIFMPKGTVIAIPIYAIHLDPDNYPDPEKFDPDRFTPEAKAKRNPYTYLPFGMGPRNCIGMRLALLELKIVLVKVLQNFTIKTCAETQVPLVLSKSTPMKPEKDILLKVEERSF